MFVVDNVAAPNRQLQGVVTGCQLDRWLPFSAFAGADLLVFGEMGRKRSDEQTRICGRRNSCPDAHVGTTGRSPDIAAVTNGVSASSIPVVACRCGIHLINAAFTRGRRKCASPSN
jgi:hypothetical protein